MLESGFCTFKRSDPRGTDVDQRVRGLSEYVHSLLLAWIAEMQRTDLSSTDGQKWTWHGCQEIPVALQYSSSKNGRRMDILGVPAPRNREGIVRLRDDDREGRNGGLSFQMQR